MLILRVAHRLPLRLVTPRMRRRCAKPSALLRPRAHRAHLMMLLLLLLALIRLWAGDRRRLVRHLALGRGRRSIVLLHLLLVRRLRLRLLLLLLLVVMVLRHGGIGTGRLLLLHVRIGLVDRPPAQGNRIAVAARGRSWRAVPARGAVSVHGDGVDGQGDDEEDTLETKKENELVSIYVYISKGGLFLHTKKKKKTALTTPHHPVRQQ